MTSLGAGCSRWKLGLWRTIVEPRVRYAVLLR